MTLKPQSFGTALKNARKDNKLTQAELAEKIDISLSYLKDLKYFRSLPSLELFVTVIEMFNLSADDVIHPVFLCMNDHRLIIVFFNVQLSHLPLK